MSEINTNSSKQLLPRTSNINSDDPRIVCAQLNKVDFFGNFQPAVA